MNQSPMILIVEDETSLAQILSDYLTQSGYQTHILHEGTDVVHWVKTHTPSLLILDLMLPGVDGLTIFRELRTFTEMPVLMATARVDEIDRLLGLELGADDYICKPYSPREVVARVKNVLRRTQLSPEPQTELGDLQLDSERYEAKVKGKLLELTAVEFRILHQLTSNLGKVYSRDQLMESIYDDHRIVSDRAIDSHIKNLRKKLHAALPEKELIKSVYGVGYKAEL